MNHNQILYATNIKLCTMKKETNINQNDTVALEASATQPHHVHVLHVPTTRLPWQT